ncbi:MAG TPA: RidA family protein [Aggregatilineales bacterium]|nr:RidA family protein [Aggregatilineales bacterium]
MTNPPSRQSVSSGTTFEDTIGYCRAVRIGNLIWVAGTVAADENTQPVGKGDPYAQTIYIFRKIEKALGEVGATLHDVVRTRMFMVNAADFGEIGRGHGEVFHDIRPVATGVVVNALIGSEYLVEIEVDACLTAAG